MAILLLAATGATLAQAAASLMRVDGQEMSLPNLLE